MEMRVVARTSCIASMVVLLLAGCANNQFGWQARMTYVGAPIEGTNQNLRLVSGPAFFCPKEAKRQKLSEKFNVRIRVDADGKVVEAKAVDAKSKLLADAALQTAMQLKFTPVTSTGKTVERSFDLPVDFRCDQVT